MGSTGSSARVLIGQGLEYQAGGSQAACHHLLELPEPKTGQAACFLLTPGGLQELNLHRPQFGSWLVGESVVQDPSLYLGTPVDPLLVLLPLLEAARGPAASASSGSCGGAGRFCDVEQILSPLGHPASQLLAQQLFAPGGGAGTAGSGSALQCVCDCKEAGGQSYFRLNDARTLAWLCVKVAAAATVLRGSHSAAFSGMDDAALRAYAAGLVGEYLNPMWRDKLRQTLGLPDADAQAAAAATARAAHHTDSQHPPEKKARLDPKEAAKQKAAEARAATKAAKLAKEASGMRKLSSFFAAHPKK